MRIAAVDLVSNTCFPALAADEFGFFKDEGLDARIELVPMLGATKALRDGARFLEAVISMSFDLRDYDYFDFKKFDPKGIDDATLALFRSFECEYSATALSG